MNNELATALARETIDAIRRGVAPLAAKYGALDGRMTAIDAALATIIEGQLDSAHKDALASVAEEVITLRTRINEVQGVANTVAETCAASLESMAALLDGKMADVLLRLQKQEKQTEDMVAAAIRDALAADKPILTALAAVNERCANVETLTGSMHDTMTKWREEVNAAFAKWRDEASASIDSVVKSVAANHKQLLEQVGATNERCTGIEALIGTTISTQMAKALADLTARMDARMEVSEGRLDKSIAAAIKDSITELASAFESMRTELAEKRGPPGEGFRYREVFSAEAEYVPGDWVTHDGTLWAAIAPSKGVIPGTPEGAASWRMAMKRARDGANGIGWNWRGNFAADELYRLNDVVRYGGRVFLCRRSTSYAPPLPGGAPATEWALLLE